MSLLQESDLATMRMLQDDHDSLTARWKQAPRYSQEVANLDVMFKAWERRVSRAIEAGLFARILAAHDFAAATGENRHE